MFLSKPNSSRTEVFNFVKSELDAVIPLLSEKRDASTYGRMNKWAALALRMKLHLNAEAWTGTAWDLDLFVEDLQNLANE